MVRRRKIKKRIVLYFLLLWKKGQSLYGVSNGIFYPTIRRKNDFSYRSSIKSRQLHKNRNEHKQPPAYRKIIILSREKSCDWRTIKSRTASTSRETQLRERINQWNVYRGRLWPLLFACVSQPRNRIVLGESVTTARKKGKKKKTWHRYREPGTEGKRDSIETV